MRSRINQPSTRSVVNTRAPPSTERAYPPGGSRCLPPPPPPPFVYYYRCATGLVFSGAERTRLNVDCTGISHRTDANVLVVSYVFFAADVLTRVFVCVCVCVLVFFPHSYAFVDRRRRRRRHRRSSHRRRHSNRFSYSRHAAACDDRVEARPFFRRLYPPSSPLTPSLRR